MKDGFERRKERSRESIRQAARELFNQFGIEKVSMVDIARKAGVSQATIYNNSGGKDALVREFMITLVDQIIDEAREITTSGKPYSEKLQLFSEFVSNITSHDKLQYNIVLFASNDLLNDPEIKKGRELFDQKIEELFIGMLREGKNKGQVNPDLSEEAFSIFFRHSLGIFSDPQLRYKLYRDPKLAQDIISLMLYGLSWQGI